MLPEKHQNKQVYVIVVERNTLTEHVFSLTVGFVFDTRTHSESARALTFKEKMPHGKP